MLKHQPNSRLNQNDLRGPLAIAAMIVTLSVSPLSVREATAQTSADSSVVLNWTAPGDDGTTGRATTYDLRYRTTAVTGTDTLTWWNGATAVTGEPIPGVSGASDSLRVRGLQPLTSYYFLIKTADEIPNWSGYSNVALKSTSGDLTAPAAIADLTITGATGTTLSLRWTAPGDDGSTGTASSYDIRYSTATITNGNWASATPVTGEPAPAVAGTVQTFTVPGLAGSQIYYVAMRTTDDRSNVAALSNVPSGNTSDTIPPAAVRDLSFWGGPGAAGGAATLFRESPAAERHDAF